MVICGLKLTHDGSIALIKDGRLLFSYEMEKFDNNSRYTGIEDTSIIERLLSKANISITDIDAFAIDGWGGYDNDALAIQPRLSIKENNNELIALNSGMEYILKVAKYHEKDIRDNVLQAHRFQGLKIGRHNLEYYSFFHVLGHILSSYSSSPFACKGENSYALVWDGGMFPRMYFIDHERGRIENLGPLFFMVGNIYTIFAQHFDPFMVNGSFAKDELSIGGKVMAYVALGKCREELFATLDDIYRTQYSAPMGFANVMAVEFKKRINGLGYSHSDLLRTFHEYLQSILVTKIQKKIDKDGKRSSNLCFAGGCALNIKWNSAIRRTANLEVYVPPFPNDSGSAIGMACAVMAQETHNLKLDWGVYSGPGIIENSPHEGWSHSQYSLQELAKLLHHHGEPVVFLSGNAELGPRALGNRSILAPAVDPKIKDKLNRIKGRESYRPVSPICLEDMAKDIFSPGTPDRYMLFDHEVRDNWREIIPGVLHLDGTARLQTVTPETNSIMAELLHHYHVISGIPLLCNTSANFNGRGFFPDILSATQWGGTNYVWCNNKIYYPVALKQVIQQYSVK